MDERKGANLIPLFGEPNRNLFNRNFFKVGEGSGILVNAF